MGPESGAWDMNATDWEWAGRTGQISEKTAKAWEQHGSEFLVSRA